MAEVDRVRSGVNYQGNAPSLIVVAQDCDRCC